MKKRENVVSMVILLVLFAFLRGLAAKSSQYKQKTLHAQQLHETVVVDGQLNESAWQNYGISDFVQSDPLDGAPATEKTFVWIGFNQDALYIAARLSDSQPDKIIGRVGRRDEWVDSDWFVFAIDPYYDRHSGYQFAVNPSGSIVDMTLYNDEGQDITWDGRWESAATIDEEGWTVEMRIPYHQLRYKKNKKPEYTWGVNFQRIIKRKNEVDVLAWTPKEESGYVSRFAKLVDIYISSSKKIIELLPFTTGKVAFAPLDQEYLPKRAPYFFTNAGIDFKMRLKTNLVLDLSINPDFGQVELDLAVINLTASETYYEEKRPFFIEGAGILNFGRGGTPYISCFGWKDPSFFYSRRIGRLPQGYLDSGRNVLFSDWVTILGAAKLTGKIGKGWNIGFISALTEREFDETELNGEGKRVEVEPFSFYGLLRIQKEFNEARQGLGFITTSVLRDFQSDDLKSSLGKSALSLAIDGWTYLNAKRSWVVTGWLGGTKVTGTKEAISNLQQSYLHYYQRPDATHVNLNENATSLNGWAGRVYLSKLGGTFLFNAALGAISPGFDTTDIGFQFLQDTINAHIHAGYVHLHPGKIFRNWHFVLVAARSYDFGWNKTYDLRFFRGVAQLLNYWEGSLSLIYCPDRWSNTLTRGGPLTKDPAYVQVDADINSDDRKPLVLSIGSSFQKGKAGDVAESASFGLQWKLNNNISMELNPSYGFNHRIAQWVGNFQDISMAKTYGYRYVFADFKQKILSCAFRINWFFSPRISLQAYVQPYITVGKYNKFKELAKPKSFDFNMFGERNSTISYGDGTYLVDPDGKGPALPFSFSNPDFNYKSLRGTIILRWEYQLGSSIYAVWTQRREDYSNPGEFSLGRDLRTLFQGSGENIFMVKFTYRFDLN